MRDLLLICVLAICATVTVLGQACPKADGTGADTPSEPRTLEGQLVYHDGIRQWFELKMDKPECGQSSTELVRGERDWTQLQVLRGCRVRSKGVIDFSPTGYYSLDTYQDVTEIEPVGSCSRKQPLPDDSVTKPSNAIRAYRVDMFVDYEPGDHPVVFRVSSAGKSLRPWQAYASYWLTGGFVLYGHCGQGFVVSTVFGTPQANPGHFDEPRTSSDMAMFDPESASVAGVTKLHLGYTCVRGR
jgi:hypothetical protein